MKRITKLLGCMGLCVACSIPMCGLTVQADNTNIISMVAPPVGGVSLLKSTLSTDEYIQAANDAKSEALYGYVNLGIANVDNNLNIRQEPGENGKLVGKLPKDAACEVLSMEDNWAYISSGDVEGYVSLDYLLTGGMARMKALEIIEPVVCVHTDGLKVRALPSTESEVLTLVADNEELEYVSDEGEWVKISLDGEEAYVFGEYVTVEQKLKTAVTMTQLLYGEGVSDVRVDLCEFAKQYVGNPYVWGGVSLTKGADCSGFVLSVFKNFGYQLSHSSRAQANEGTKISMKEAKPGDLIFYGNSKGTINHVAIYIGGSQVIHASSPKTGIKISKYNYRTPVKVVRIIND